MTVPANIRLVAALLAALLTVHAPAQDQDDDAPPVRTGLVWLDWVAEQVDFTLREAEPAAPEAQPMPDEAPAPVSGEAADSTEMPVLSPTHSIETMEMLRLQQEVRLLRELIEEGMVGRVTALENEVHELKAALNGQRPAGPVVPQPNALAQPRLPLPEQAKPKAAVKQEMPLEQAVPDQPFSFTVVDEWGRSPEAVAELGGKASTLIGLSGLVPEGSARSDVVNLAHELRTKYKDYDNIVIEVFDSEAAARTFADAQTVDAESRVLSIAKSKAEGRDLMFYFGGALPEALTP